MSIDANWADEEWRHDAMDADPHDFTDYSTPIRAEAERDEADAADWQ